jgi:hypothetical protein
MSVLAHCIASGLTLTARNAMLLHRTQQTTRTHRGAILTLHDGELEPAVLQYPCVHHPEPKDVRSHADVHLDALMKVCPYMPSTFREFVDLATKLGPAQPLAGLRGTDVIGTNGSANGPANGSTNGATATTAGAAGAAGSSAGSGSDSGSRSNSGAGVAVGGSSSAASSSAVMSKGSSRNLRSSAVAASMEADAKAAVPELAMPAAVVIDVPPPPATAADDEKPQQLARMSPHDKFAYESRNDRLNEQHPVVTERMFQVCSSSSNTCYSGYHAGLIAHHAAVQSQCSAHSQLLYWCIVSHCWQLSS